MKRILVWVLALCLSFSCAGCFWMDGTYVSVTPHQLGYDRPEEEAPVVRDFIDLRNSIVDLIDSGTSEGVFLLDDYLQKDVELDMIRAETYILSTHPIGSYSVEGIDYAFGSSGGKPALSVSIRYRRTKAEVDRIRSVRSINGAKSAIATALENHQSSLLLMIMDYQSVDFVQWITDYVAQHPELVMELPKVSVAYYPKHGRSRVAEFTFTFQNSHSSLHQMQAQVKQVFSSAALYVSSHADDLTKFSQLYTFLMERFDYRMETSLTPSYSLLCHGVGDSKAFAEVYSAMCRQSGLTCITVPGSYQGQVRHWNMVQCNGSYYHVDLLQSLQAGKLQLLRDEQMTGYVWDYSAYPAGGSQIPEESSAPPAHNMNRVGG